jgi:hypothetical protein
MKNKLKMKKKKAFHKLFKKEEKKLLGKAQFSMRKKTVILFKKDQKLV